MGAVSKVVWVHNYSSSALTITSIDGGAPDQLTTCPAGASTFVGYKVVPWCKIGSEFATHHMTITVAGVPFFAWQHWDTDDNWVRRTTTGFTSTDIPPFTPAPHFPGTALGGGDRSIEVSPGGAFRLRENT
jgi:hypothetical protein